MASEGEAVTLQALLEDTDHSQGRQPDIYGGVAFNTGWAVRLEGIFTLKAVLLYTSQSSGAALAHLDCQRPLFL